MSYPDAADGEGSPPGEAEVDVSSWMTWRRSENRVRWRYRDARKKKLARRRQTSSVSMAMLLPEMFFSVIVLLICDPLKRDAGCPVLLC